MDGVIYLSHLFLRIGRLPRAKDLKKDMYATFDTMMTFFEGHLLIAACLEHGISSVDSDFPQTIVVFDVASRVVERPRLCQWHSRDYLLTTVRTESTIIVRFGAM